MKILIIDDNPRVAKKVAEAIAGLGEISICTSEDQYSSEVMPSRDDVVTAIQKADLILLDGQICSRYSGRDLLPFCEGKVVLGISTSINLGKHNWFDKDELIVRDEGKNEVAIASLREKVEQMLTQ